MTYDIISTGMYVVTAIVRVDFDVWLKVSLDGQVIAEGKNFARCSLRFDKGQKVTPELNATNGDLEFELTEDNTILTITRFA